MADVTDFFDLTGIELVKKKYYNAAKVAEVAAAAESAYAALQRENAQLKAKLDELEGRKDQISDTLMSARELARQMAEDARMHAEESERMARAQAEEIISAAEKKAELILAGAKSSKEASDADVSEVQEYALRCVENCVEKLRRQHMDAIELINAQWQDFLGGLMLPEDRAVKADEVPALPEAPEVLKLEPAVDWMAIANMELPEMDDPYGDIDADTFFSGAFFNEQTGGDVFAELKAMMESIENPKDGE